MKNKLKGSVVKSKEGCIRDSGIIFQNTYDNLPQNEINNLKELKYSLLSSKQLEFPAFSSTWIHAKKVNQKRKRYETKHISK